MGKETHIEWCDHTFNPWIGCSAISPGCTNCYAARMAKRFPWGDCFTSDRRHITSSAYWRQALAWNRKAAAAGEKRLVFCGSMCDVCDPKAPDGLIFRLFELINSTPSLIWLLLTKRPERFPSILPQRYWGDGWDNVMLMVTAEDQKRADWLIPQLLRTPAKFRGVSIEPALENVDIRKYLDPRRYCKKYLDGIESEWGEQTELIRWPLRQLPLDRKGEYLTPDWIIVGGESGPGARPMPPELPVTLRDQCRAAGVPFFFKQWGGVNKKKTGCLLDGVECKEFPGVFFNG